jgi:serine/threonine-protein kinase
LAETYLLKRDYEKAEYYFNQCILMGKAQGDMLVTREDLYLMWDKDTERGRQSLEEDKSRLGKQSNAFNTHYKFRIEMIDRNYEEALRALNQDSFYSINHQFLYKPKSLYYAEVYHKQNNIEKATAYYDSARIHLEAKISVSRQDSRFHSSLGIAYAGLGKKAEAIREGQAGIDLMPITKDSYRGIFRLKDMARIYIMVGEYDKAIEVLDQLLSMPSLVSVNLLKKEPVWEPLWDLPEFKELIEKHSDN